MKINCDPSASDPSFEPTQHPIFVPYHMALGIPDYSRTECVADTASNHMYDGSNYVMSAACCDKFGLQPGTIPYRCFNGSFAEVQSFCSNYSLTVCPSSSYKILSCTSVLKGFWSSESCVPTNVSLNTSAPGITSNPATTPTSTPTVRPTITPITSAPTAFSLNPTLSPTMDPNNGIITFGHTQNNTEHITLYLEDFHPQNIDQINLIDFGVQNGSVSFEPCTLFETYTAENILFDQLLLANVSVFLSYSEPAELHAGH
eukprot:878686_1